MKLQLRFPPHLHGVPNTAEVILETGARMNIERAYVDAVRGELIIDVPRDKVERVMELFKQRGVEVRRLVKLIAWDEDRCIHCGACISVCPSHVFKFDHTWRLNLEEEKCIKCDVCVRACPVCALASTSINDNNGL